MNQMIKVLASPKLMLIPFEEFERIISQCFVIFNTWEEEYDKVNSKLYIDHCSNITSNQYKAVQQFMLPWECLYAEMLCVQ